MASDKRVYILIRTSLEVAKRVGVHSNTIRLYEKLELIPKADVLHF